MMTDVNQFSPSSPRFTVTSWMCRGGLLDATRLRHLACPHKLGRIGVLDDEEFKCACKCHTLSLPTAVPKGT